MIGEKIYKLRTDKNLSQGDLADMLNVSRQSISKWENNITTPDLDKIIQMSDIFGISIDELVRGNNETTQVENMAASISTQSNVSLHFIIGVILLNFAILTILLFILLRSFLTGLLLAIPLVVCGCICIICKKNCGLWCAWALFIIAYVFMYHLTGVTPSSLLLPLWLKQGVNQSYLIAGGIELLFIIALLFTTIKRFGKIPLPMNRNTKRKFIGGWILIILLYIVEWLISKYLVSKILSNNLSFGAIYSIVSCAFGLLKLLLFSYMLQFSVRYRKSKKAIKNTVYL